MDYDRRMAIARMALAPEGKSWVSRKHPRAWILRKQARASGIRCYWCGDRMLGREPYHPRKMTFEHMDPKNKKACRFFACRECNHERGDRPIKEHWDLLAARRMDP